jgi:hypothetical protein
MVWNQFKELPFSGIRSTVFRLRSLSILVLMFALVFGFFASAAAQRRLFRDHYAGAGARRLAGL